MGRGVCWATMEFLKGVGSNLADLPWPEGTKIISVEPVDVLDKALVAIQSPDLPGSDELPPLSLTPGFVRDQAGDLHFGGWGARED